MPLFPNKYQPSSAYFAPVAALMILFALSCQSSRHLDPGQTNKGVSHNRTILDAEQPVAVPAYPHPIEFVQPDRSTIIIQLKGDERVNWAETPDGYTILVTSEGFYEYAIHNDAGELVFSGHRVSDIEARSADEKSFLQDIPNSDRHSDANTR